MSEAHRHPFGAVDFADGTPAAGGAPAAAVVIPANASCALSVSLSWTATSTMARGGSVKLMDPLPSEAISSVPEVANRTPFAFVVDSLLVRATDYSVGHRDR